MPLPGPGLGSAQHEGYEAQYPGYQISGYGQLAGAYSTAGSGTRLNMMSGATGGGHDMHMSGLFGTAHPGYEAPEQYFSSRASLNSHPLALPTVCEDDMLSGVKGLESAADQEVDLAVYAAAACSQRRSMSRTVSLAELQHLSHQSGQQPCRVLVVRDVPHDTSEEELRNIFQAFGDLHGMHTRSRSAGVLVVAYYDLRAAQSAQNNLHGTLIGDVPINVSYAAQPGAPTAKLLSHQGQVVFYNLDPNSNNEQLLWLFGKFGDVQSVDESPSRPNQKFITFYDLRHAAAAMQAMNHAEHMNKLPSSSNLQKGALTHSASGTNLSQQMTHRQGADSWNSAPASPATMDGLMHLHRFKQQQAAAVGGGVGAASPPHAAGHGSQHSMGLGAGHGSQHSMLGTLQMGSMDLGPRGLPPSDSASSIASSVQVGVMIPPGGPTRLKGMPGMPPPAGASRRFDGASPPQHLQNLYPHPYQPHQQQTHPVHPSAMYSAAADYQAAAQQQEQQRQLHLLQQTNEAAAMLMGLGLGEGGVGGGMPGGAGQGEYGQPGAGLPWNAENQEGLGRQGFQHDTPLAPSTGYWPIPGGGQDLLGGGLGLPNQLAALQELQLRQHHQQQQHLLQSFGGEGGPGGSAASLQAAVHILQQAGLGLGSQMGGAGMGSLASSYPPGSSGMGNMHAAAAAHILQQAGLGLHGMGGMGGPAGLNPLMVAAQAARGVGMGGSSRGSSGVLGSMTGGHMGSDMGVMGMGMNASMGSMGSLRADNRSGGRLSRRTTDPSAEAERKVQQEKLYAVDLEKIARGEDRRTTLMVKNIPNKYTQKMLLATIDEYFRGMYDFFYLPIDFKNKCNVGYAFINMVLPVHIIPLVQRFNHKKWERFNSEKVCHISYARIQGRAALVQHFQNSSLMHEDKRCRPILFTLDDAGDQAGDQEPFPVPSTPSSLTGHMSSNALNHLGVSMSGSMGRLHGSSNSLHSMSGHNLRSATDAVGSSNSLLAAGMH